MLPQSLPSLTAPNVRLIGPIRIETGALVTAGFRSSRVPALLAFLVLRNGGEARREEIADALWPQLLPEAARNNLRVTLRYLRQVLEAHGLESGLRAEDRTSLALDPAVFATDISVFEGLRRAGRFEEAFAVANAELLPGLYDAWIEPYRDQYRVGRAESAVRVARSLIDTDPGRVVGLCEAVLEEDLFVSEARELLAAATSRSGGGLKPADRHFRTTPPRERTRFYGREEELAAIEAWAGGSDRLLTVYGPGGMGKTRLGSEAAGRLAERGVVVWVDVAGAGRPGALSDAVAAGLGTGGAVPGSSLEQITAVLHGRRAVIVLDNGETITDEGIVELDEMLEGLPLTQALCLSRKTLGLPGERTLRLDPLRLPTSDADREAPALAMLLDRAGDVTVDEDLLALARELEGLPLAIELAAAKTSTLSVRELLAEMNARLDVLVGRGSKQPRHRTMRATLDWSFDLLEPELRDAVLDLSILQNGWTVEAAGALREPDSPVTTLEVLEAGCTNSLFVRSVNGGESRFRMLECTREYALEILPPSRRARLRRRHAAYYRHLALSGVEFQRLESERANLLAALETFAEFPDEGDLPIFAEALLRFWMETSAGRTALRILEGVRVADAETRARLNWVRAMIYRSISSFAECEAAAREALADAGDVDLRIRLLALSSRVFRVQGRIEEAYQVAKQALELAQNRSTASIAEALLVVGQTKSLLDVDPETYDTSRQVVEMAKRLGDLYFLDEALDTLRLMHFRRGELDEAEAIAHEQEALPLPRTAAREAQRQIRLGQVAINRGATEEGRVRFETALASAREAAHPWWMGQALAQLGDAHTTLGRFAEGRRAHQEAHDLRLRTGERRALGSCLRGLGLASMGLGEMERAYEELERARGIAVESEDEFFLATVLPPFARAAAATGRKERAIEALREMIVLCERLERHPDLLRELDPKERIAEARAMLESLDH